MKKKIIIAFLCAMVLGATACGSAEVDSFEKNTENVLETEECDTEAESTETENVEIVTESTEEMSEETEETEEVPEEVIPDSIQGMLAPMDAILLASYEGEVSYEQLSAASIWRFMYYVIVDHGYAHQLAEYEEGYIKLRRMAVYEYAAAMFENADLPEIPNDFQDLVRYDADWDAYFFMLSDRGMTESEIVSASENPDGSYDVTVKLYDIEEESVIATAVFHLVENKTVDGISDPLFYWTIVSVKEVK